LGLTLEKVPQCGLADGLVPKGVSASRMLLQEKFLPAPPQADVSQSASTQRGRQLDVKTVAFMFGKRTCLNDA